MRLPAPPAGSAPELWPLPEQQAGGPELERVAALVADHAGIVRPAGNNYLLRRAVATRMASLGIGRLAEYLRLLGQPGGKPELEELSQLVTIRKTSFFRNRPQFDFLQGVVLPALAAERGGTREPVRIWSAGCSTGEEPYSLAMCLVPLQPAVSARVLASDISRPALEQARSGSYPSAALSELRPAELALVERQAELWQPNDQVRRLVEFTHHNLVTWPYPLRGGPWDVIFCRNVLIYFNAETVGEVIERFHAVLRPGGYLFLGASESLFDISNDFLVEVHGDAFVYRKPEKEPPARLRPARPRPAAKRPWRRPALAPAPGPGRAPHAPATSPAGASGRQRADQDDPHRQLRLARERLAHGQREAAFRMLFALTARHPQMLEPYLLLGRLAAESGRLEEGLSFYLAAAETRPLEPVPRFMLAVLLYRCDRLREAREELRKLLFANGDFLPGHYYQGMVARELGDGELARRSWNNVLRLAETGADRASREILREHNLDARDLVAASKLALARLES